MTLGSRLRPVAAIPMMLGTMACASVLGVQNRSPAATAERIERIFAAAHAADEFHGSVLVGEGDTLIYRGSFGLADRAQHRPIDGSTAFPIASVTKPIVATTLLRLQDLGVLDLDDPVVRHLHAFPYPTITIRHLLQHTSGLKMNLGKVLVGLAEGRIADNRRVLQVLYSVRPPLISPPGDRFEYSNVGYIVLAELIASAAGAPYREVVRKQVFEPAGMTNAGFMHAQSSERLAKTYFKDDHGRWVLDTTSNDYTYVLRLAGIQGNGDVVCTAADLWRFDRALHRGLLPNTALADMHRPARRPNGGMVWQTADRMQSYGLGWSIDRRRRSYWHTGEWGGALAWFKRYPKAQRVAVVLQNHRSAKLVWVRKLERILDR